MPSKKRKGLSQREYDRKMQVQALKKKVLYSGFKNGKNIDYSNKKYKGYTITSLD